MMSKNRCLLFLTYSYVNQHTNSKRKNIFIGMVTRFKNNSQQACSVSTFLLIDLWNYCTQSYKYSHALPQGIAKSLINFQYKL